MSKKMIGYAHLPPFLRDISKESLDTLEKTKAALDELIKIKGRELVNRELKEKRETERLETLNLIKTEIRYIKNRRVIRSQENSKDIDDLNEYSLGLIEDLVSKLDRGDG